MSVFFREPLVSGEIFTDELETGILQAQDCSFGRGISSGRWTFQRDVIFRGLIKGKTAHFDGSLVVGETALFEKNVTINGTLSVDGEAEFQRNVTVTESIRLQTLFGLSEVCALFNAFNNPAILEPTMFFARGSNPAAQGWLRFVEGAISLRATTLDAITTEIGLNQSLLTTDDVTFKNISGGTYNTVNLIVTKSLVVGLPSVEGGPADLVDMRQVREIFIGGATTTQTLRFGALIVTLRGETNIIGQLVVTGGITVAVGGINVAVGGINVLLGGIRVLVGGISVGGALSVVGAAAITGGIVVTGLSNFIGNVIITGSVEVLGLATFAALVTFATGFNSVGIVNFNHPPENAQAPVTFNSIVVFQNSFTFNKGGVWNDLVTFRAPTGLGVQFATGVAFFGSATFEPGSGIFMNKKTKLHCFDTDIIFAVTDTSPASPDRFFVNLITSFNNTVTFGQNVSFLRDVTLTGFSFVTNNSNITFGDSGGSSLLNVQPAAIFSKTVSVTGLLTALGELRVTGLLTALGDLSVTGFLTALGELRVTGLITALSDLVVGVDTTLKGVLEVLGNAFLRSSVTVDGMMTVLGNAIFRADVAVDGVLTVLGNAFFRNDVTIDGRLNLAAGPVSLEPFLTEDWTLRLGYMIVTLGVDGTVIVQCTGLLNDVIPLSKNKFFRVTVGANIPLPALGLPPCVNVSIRVPDVLFSGSIGIDISGDLFLETPDSFPNNKLPKDICFSLVYNKFL